MIALAQSIAPSLTPTLPPSALGEWIRRKRRPRPPVAATRTIAMADLFSGCGGLTLGALEAARRLNVRTEIRLAVDQDPTCVAVYGDNFQVPANRLVCGSMSDLVPGPLGTPITVEERLLRAHVGKLDILLAGPPCQGHSDLNNHSRRDDPKNLLYLRAVRFIEIVRPTVAIIENVPAARHDRNKVVQKAAEFLKTLGYHAAYTTISACAFGLPQGRRRLVLIAALYRDPAILFSRYKDSKKVYPLRSLIGDLEDGPKAAAEGDIFATPSQMTPQNRHRVEFLFRTERYDLPNSKRPACHRDKKHSYKSMYGRLHWDRPAQTITGGFGSMGQGRYVHPSRPRVITPHEAARIQGFPDYFDFKAANSRRVLHQMIGNAVPPVMAFRPVSDMLAAGFMEGFG